MKIDQNFVAIITGGASGLGQSVVKDLSAKGSKIIIADNNQELGNKIASQYKSEFYHIDVTDQNAVQKLFQYVKKKYGRIDFVLNSAGIYHYGFMLFRGQPESTDKLRKLLDINVIGTFNVCKFASKYMAEQQLKNGQRGLIVNVASIAGIDADKGHTIYAATKGAIVAMTLPMARDLGRYKIRVMTLAPGVFRTPMSSIMEGTSMETMTKKLTPLNKLGDPSQFSHLILAIIQNPFASGSVWRLDGGYRSAYL